MRDLSVSFVYQAVYYGNFGRQKLLSKSTQCVMCRDGLLTRCKYLKVDAFQINGNGNNHWHGKLYSKKKRPGAIEATHTIAHIHHQKLVNSGEWIERHSLGNKKLYPFS